LIIKRFIKKALVSMSLWEEISKYTYFDGVVCQVSPLSILAEWKEVLVPQHFHGLLFGQFVSASRIDEGDVADAGLGGIVDAVVGFGDECGDGFAGTSADIASGIAKEGLNLEDVALGLGEVVASFGLA